jgi:hypothetical protein
MLACACVCLRVLASFAWIHMSARGTRRCLSNEDRDAINAYNANASSSKLPTRFQGYNVDYLKALGVLPDSIESPTPRDAYKAWATMNKNVKKTTKLGTTLVTLDAGPFMPVIKAAVAEAMEDKVRGEPRRFPSAPPSEGNLGTLLLEVPSEGLKGGLIWVSFTGGRSDV